MIWKKAYCPKPTLPEATEFGWKRTEKGSLKPILMTKDAIPEDALKFTSCSCKTGCSTKRCGCKKMKVQCSLYCKCVKNNFVCCSNAPILENSEDDDELEIMP